MILGLVCSSRIVMAFIVRVVACRYFEKEVCCAISTRSMLVINFGSGRARMTVAPDDPTL
jgi:hypothetical protein